MKAFTNANPKDLKEASALLADAAKKGQSTAIAGGGSDVPPEPSMLIPAMRF